MRSHSILIVSLFLTTAVTPQAQQATSEIKRETAEPQRNRRPAPIVSPEVAANREVTFRLQAPNATKVRLLGQWPDGTVDMDKDEKGVWKVSTPPIAAGVWEYKFQVDGLSMIDPSNPAIKPMRQPRTSILHILGTPLNNYDFQDIPHGAVHSHAYLSKSLNRLREVMVYTPPSYNHQSNRAYPTLYLQHGSGDNHATWVVHGKAHWIIDNLIAQEKSKPMVIVMMDGHASMDRQSNTKLFERDLLEDVLPFIESNYRVERDSAHRAIVGLSMGGGQSLTIGLNHSNQFSWVGGFSSSAPRYESIESAIDDSNETNQGLNLLWIACGHDDFLLERNKDFIALLTDKKIHHEWILTDGNHSWPVWREYLEMFLPRLFH